MQKKENKKNDDKNFAHAVISWYPRSYEKDQRTNNRRFKIN